MTPLMVKGTLFGLLLLSAAVWDMRNREIPNLIPILLFLCGLIGFRPAASTAGLLLVGGPFLLAAVLIKRDGFAIGGGDVKLMGACGFVLGVWPGLIGMGLIPFWYVLFTSHSYKKLMNNEIETGLSIITSSYLRSESIITAVEENIHYLNPPVADVFRGFLAETGMISADVKQALSNMKPKLDNYIFREWVDAAIACQDDKSLKSTLTPIIGKLSDMRIVAAELDYLMYEPFKEFITMAFLLVGNIPLLYFLNKDWYNVLVNTGFGKGILAVCLLVLLISFAAVIRLTKPVEYKR